MTLNITFSNPLNFLIDQGNDKYLIREMNHILDFLSCDLIDDEYDFDDDFKIPKVSKEYIRKRMDETYKKLYIVKNRKKIIKSIIKIQIKYRSRKSKS
jgi:hypothetical protein